LDDQAKLPQRIDETERAAVAVGEQEENEGNRPTGADGGCATLLDVRQDKEVSLQKSY
jgi:hypothetical protein